MRTKRTRKIPPVQIRPAESDLIKCRDLGHRWDEVVPLAKRRSMFAQVRESRCDRCDSVKVETINVYGQIENRWYDLSDEYRLYTGISRADARSIRMGSASVVDA